MCAHGSSSPRHGFAGRIQRRQRACPAGIFLSGCVVWHVSLNSGQCGFEYLELVLVRVEFDDPLVLDR